MSRTMSRTPERIEIRFSVDTELPPPNGPAAAALLATGFGCSVLALLALAADASRPIARALTWYRPTGPLSGVTTLALVLWLLVWILLAALWRNRTVRLARILAFALAFLALGLLLTFPPIGDLLLGK